MCACMFGLSCTFLCHKNNMPEATCCPKEDEKLCHRVDAHLVDSHHEAELPQSAHRSMRINDFLSHFEF